MSNAIERFGLRVIGATRQHVSPFVLVLLKTWSEYEGKPCISANLMTEREIDEHFDNLVADLEAVRKQAKAALAKAKER